MDSKDRADKESLILENRKLMIRNKILWKKISLISSSEKRRNEEYFQTQVQILKLEIEIEKEKMAGVWERNHKFEGKHDDES